MTDSPLDVGSDATLRRAVGSMAVATLFFFFMSVAVKAADGLPTLQIVFFRAFVALIIGLVQLRIAGVSLRGTHRGLLAARGVFGTLALVCYFWSLGQLPLAAATVLQGLAPIFTALLAVTLLGERIRPVQIGLFALAAVGVWLVEGDEASGTPLGIAVAVTGAALSACAYASISAVGDREHPLVIVAWFPLVTVPVIAPFLPWFWVWPTPGQWVALVAVGVFVQVAQIGMTRAYQLGPAGPVSLASYLGVVWATLGGWLIFGETLGPKGMFGVLLVVAAVIGVTRSRG